MSECKIIRCSKHYFNSFSNIGKDNKLSLFLQEYRRAVQFYVDYLFDNGTKYNIGTKEIILNIKNNQLDCPNFISTIGINFETTLSARALKCASTQACGMIKGLVAEKKKLIFIRNKLLEKKEDTTSIDEKIAKIKLSKPIINNRTPAELSSLCCNFEIEKDKHFNGFIVIGSIGKAFGKISLPIKFTKHSNKYKNKPNSILKPSFLISERSIDFRWEFSVEQKEAGIIVGMDTGMNKTAVLSDGQRTMSDNHGHNLQNITDKLARKKKGSKAFRRAQDHRENYINWSINQLNFEHIKQINIENVFDLRRGKRTSRKNSHWTNSLTEDKITNRAEEEGVLLQWNPSFYRSQRCFPCGFVSEENRNKEEFHCINCRHKDDADLNAAKNHTLELPNTYYLKDRLKELDSFFFKEDGFFLEDGSELTAPITKKK